MLWMTKELDLLTEKVEIMLGQISDHIPILWKTIGKHETERRWIINEDTLDKKEILDSLRKDIKDYFDLN